MKRVAVSVAEGYRQWSKDYDQYENPLIALEEPLVRELLGPVQGQRVLDAGCGTGRHAAWLAGQGARVVGVDESEEMLAIARRKHPSLDVRHGSVLDPDFPAGSFDRVLNALMAEHVAEARALLSVLSRLVPRDGRLLVPPGAHPSKGPRGVHTPSGD